MKLTAEIDITRGGVITCRQVTYEDNSPIDIVDDFIKNVKKIKAGLKPKKITIVEED